MVKPSPMNIAGHDIGVCTWSLKPKDTADMIATVKSLGLEHIQLALAPLVMLDDKQKHFELGLLRSSGLKITAGMINFPGEDYSSIAAIRQSGGFVPDDWDLRRRLSVHSGALAAEMGLTRVSTHIGFIPPSSYPAYSVLVDRVKEIAASFAPAGIDLLMETGQEEATELLQFLNDVGQKNVGVNFDPANMLMYGAGDPIEAITTLGRHIRHVHVKDGRMSEKPGVDWGTEVPFGVGQVKVGMLLEQLRSVGYRGPLVIEREAGDQRVADVRTAIETLKKAAGGGS